MTDGERVYVYFGNVGLFCYDFSGKLLWSNAAKPMATRYGWGTAASPVLDSGRLYLVHDNDDHSYLEALDAKTGKTVWAELRVPTRGRPHTHTAAPRPTDSVPAHGHNTESVPATSSQRRDGHSHNHPHPNAIVHG